MTSAISLAQTVTYDSTPTSWRLPPFIWSAFTALNQIHYAWKWYRRFNLYQQPNNLFQLLTGHLVNLVIGDSLLIRVAAQSLMIARRILECIQQQSIIVELAGSLWQALCGHYINRPSTLEFWHAQSAHRHLFFFSPSTVYWWKISAFSLYHRICRIASIILDLGKALFNLSMKIMDVIDIFDWNPETKNEAINESILNLSKCLESVVNNKEELLMGLQTNQAIIKRLLSSTPFSYQQLEMAVRHTIQTTETIHGHIQTISTAGNGILLTIGKRMVNGVSAGLGLEVVYPQ